MAVTSSTQVASTSHQPASAPPCSASFVLKSTIPYHQLSGRQYGAYFLLECASKLGAGFITSSIGAIMYHRFFRETSDQRYDVYVIAAACLHMSSQLHQNPPIELIDIVNVTSTIAAGGNTEGELDAPDMMGSFKLLRQSLLDAQLLVLRMLRFQLPDEAVLPQKYLVIYLESVEMWTGIAKFRALPITRTAWTLVNDSFLGEFVSEVKPQHVALACMHIAFQTYAFVVPCSTDVKVTWHEALCNSCTVDVLWNVTGKLLDVYESDRQIAENKNKQQNNKKNASTSVR